MKNKGQALVEFAFIAIILMVLTLGIFEFGRAMYVKNTLNNAARAGVRVAAVTPAANLTVDTSGTPMPNQCSNIDNSYSNKDVLTTVCNSLVQGVPINKVKVTLEDVNKVGASDFGPGDTIKVTVIWDTYTPVTGLIKITNKINGEASMRHE